MRVFYVLILCAAIMSMGVFAFAQPSNAAGSIIVTFRSNVAVTSPFSITLKRLHALQEIDAVQSLSDDELPRYTNDAPTNRILLSVGVNRIERVLSNLSAPAVYRLNVTMPVRSAVTRLRRASAIASASADWYVSPMTRPFRL